MGGSVAGLSTAHAVLKAGWDVVVLEKAHVAPKGSPTGAGLAIDTQSIGVIESWLPDPQLLQDTTFPLDIDENFHFRSGHWSDLHGLLHDHLPPEVFLWGHLFLSFTTSEDKSSVTVKAKVLDTEEIIEITGNVLIAADGSLSAIRKTFLPDMKLRYSGYCAWRGVLHFAGHEDSETITGIRRAYPDLGKCLYFSLDGKSHTIMYELHNKRLNWIWYVNRPEPELKPNSVTLKVSEEEIKSMIEEAKKTWVPEFVRVMEDTMEPFINAIYDADPLERLYWDNVVLVGDASHPTTPHGVRSTNFAIMDAASLGRCLGKWGVENVQSALEEYQNTRLPVHAKQVLYSRRLGQLKQGMALPDRGPFDIKTATPKECEELQQKNMPFAGKAPL
ncbi:hypothetical protein Tsubulata_038654 [Turnera subulata]|uniref:FAD-binding domain-containing protein n=1 Tax=Turnera subulata TaxID=218843 RepID=A0A9Q0G6Z8_9ROSI|nr:hypothetical protein Tsubulata_038654 [Turnera subulata]